MSRQVVRQMLDLSKKYGTSLLLVTHNMGVAAYMSDYIGVMQHGKMVEWGKAEVKSGDMSENMRHPYAKRLLGSVFSVGDKGKKVIELEESVPGDAAALKGCSYAPRCKECTERCRAEKPARREAEPGHFISCFQCTE